MSKYSQEERIERRSLFTVSDIEGNDILAWRAERARKEEEWMAAKAKKYQYVIDAMGDGSLLTKTYGPSETTRVWADYSERMKRKEITREQVNEVRKQDKPSVLQKTLNWFLNLKFEV